ncbi:lantibiotic immunity ABC transporter MutE/EpiE family permease subunit [Clostridium akagii]|uniref:lantibiotic immunity ABC transporter MutE/EpiE family permease subunit n=1 Tax=Clostridium akagii TaxID=91623 RepID=UPI00068A2338|nr:lantibiotic immunity ABC transporter MutE/EpiE family permease subunit [Clostridium akagii]
MINIIESEYIKYKRTFTRKLIIIAPIFCILMALCMPWKMFVQQAYSLWAVSIIPIGIALFAAIAGMQEKKAGNYRNLLVHNISPARIWIGKIIVMSINSLLSIIVLSVATIIIFPIVNKGGIPWTKILVGSSIMWLTSLAIIPLQLFVATLSGILGSMALGFLGLIAGIFASGKSYWMYVPWSYATRLLCPTLDVGTNGVPLQAGDPFLNASVIPVGIIASIISLVVFTCITALWFNKREVR